MVATEVDIFIDGGGIQWRGRAGRNDDCPGTRATTTIRCDDETIKEVSTIRAHGIYIPFSCRWDRVVKLGGTEMDNC